MPKTVLITGGTSGIGLGIAREFAKAGYNLYLNGLEPNGEAITAELAAAHSVAGLFSNANMLQPDAIAQMV